MGTIEAPLMVASHDRRSLRLDDQPSSPIRFNNLNPGERGRLIHRQSRSRWCCG
jgi:hypothetical protein